MKTKSIVLSMTTFVIALLGLAACSGSADIGSLPVYPGATELKAGESTVGDTLAQNAEQDAAMRQALGSLGGEVAQKGFQLPSETTWEQVNGFYEKELGAAGWSSGMGGLASSFIDVNAMMNTANEGNELFKTSLWSKGKQALTVIMVTDPVDSTRKQLLLSLSNQ